MPEERLPTGETLPTEGTLPTVEAVPVDAAEAVPVDAAEAPAYYARQGGRWGGRWSDWWTVLHPPYTLWHLSYVLIGAALAPRMHWLTLGASVLAFFLAVGLAAHALDELNGRPLRTHISDRALWVVAVAALGGAVALGVVMVPVSGLALVPFIVIGVVLVLGYNLELFGGRLHTDLGFALAWGGFPLAVGFVAQAPPWPSMSVLAAVAGCAAATTLSYAQRQLSTPARTLRRRTAQVVGEIRYADGSIGRLDRAVLLTPLEGALRTLSWTVPLVAVALLLRH